MAEPLLACRGLSKSFGPVKANRRIDLDLHPGEVHALLGENGAGKSTLMSMLAGRYRPDEGAILLRGEQTRFTSPAKAWEAGIGMVYQRFMLVDSFTAAENVRLAVPGVGRRELRALGERYGLAVNPDARVADLSMGERQRVEILKLLARGAKVLIFDEPTSSLSPPEVDSLFEIMERLKAEGHALVFITHKLDEVMRTADVISILRRGRIVAGGLRPSDISNRRELARLMVGREVVLSVDKEPVEKGGVVLRARGLRGAGPSPAFADVNLEVRKGEVVALAGVAGNGQSRLAKALAGVEPAGEGTVSCLDVEFPAAKFRGIPRWPTCPRTATARAAWRAWT
ncbi:ATP-binding cassette domain-containing protein [Desulfohalovibrio reitneri]|uniref:ATP-binding cassette domain-containing protein n=1 Tax=Desulfohalovibrio reitneri TaxID=1307759 RepID=UPI000A43DCE5